MAQLVPAETFDLVIFGGTGDLAMRKLLPALYHRDLDGQLTPESRIIAASRGELAREDYLERVEDALRRNLAEDEFDETFWATFAARIHYVQADASAHEEWSSLAQLLNGVEERVRVAYLATAPSLFGAIAQGLKHNGLVTESSRIVLEKPLGRDLDSAREINNEIAACFAESQVYRIDHYLGKETVQNLLALRFGNSLFEPLWRRSTIDNVQITVAEDLGVGGRVEFYDRVGALRDMVQNHLMQLVCLFAMEPPSSLDHNAVRDEKIKVLRSLKPISAADVGTSTVRGQPHSIFPEQKFNVKPNMLRIRLQPDEGVQLSIMAKEPGPGGFDLRPVALDLSFAETFSVRYPDAYERLLMEVLRGNPALFMRRDEVEAAWRWVDGVIDSWETSKQKVESYVSGTWGPSASALLLDRDGRSWIES
jgi:glucose-6-phosphate 1-dehydrogenase